MSSSTSMKAYLAAHYMSGAKAEAITAQLDPAAKKKKKKSKVADTNAASSSFIKDMDEDLRWGKPVDDEEDEEEKALVEKDRSFKKRKVEPANDGGGWIKVQGDETDGGVEEVAMEEAHVAAPAAGLVMPSEFKSAQPQALDKKKKKKSKRTEDDDAEEQGETVYRDASGRRVQVESAEDIAARQAEEEREKREKEREKKEWQKGLVQREQAELRRRELEQERSRNVARRADDKELNESQKAEERWNDPAAAFLTKKEKKGPKRPEYKGPPPPPNRFGIKPGYRWDGVDRSNGFEKKYFQTINEKGRTKLEAYQWSVDDM
ncbi:Pre-mRNA-splicing factor cwc26 [Tulasnella sp. 424]|nr:Pre-mRNA-splicing factor cwc26 [Tulasnella sp. 424]KAG8966211.1 Pre-mRNA-splicing factor cwc26 [Tulasnella sp. 425]